MNFGELTFALERPSGTHFDEELLNVVFAFERKLTEVDPDVGNWNAESISQWLRMVNRIRSAKYEYILYYLKKSIDCETTCLTKQSKFDKLIIDYAKLLGYNRNEREHQKAVDYTSKERNSPRYAAWRGSVLIRDNFTCMRCGDTQGPLHAHHIEPYGNDQEKAYDPRNGITLCIYCHRDFHSRYGNNAGSIELKESLGTFWDELND